MMHTIQMKFIRLLCLSLLLPALAWGQAKTVSGVVKDGSGETVIGASVLEKGTTNGVVTDIDGKFSLSVSSQQAILTISYVGYVAQDVTTAGKTQLSIILQEDTQVTEEVVVIGYGTARRSDVTGSIASVSSESIREVPASNISQALQGRMAGVEMSQTSTKPGAEMQIRIRGTRSLNASNDPLVVLDGIPFAGSIGDINPNDIKSIDILKDASATAIYGSRGANGVILVTTNKGQSGQKATVTLNSYYGTKEPFGRYPMMTGAEFAQLRKDAGLYSNSIDENDATNTDWQDMLYRTGTVTSEDLGISGGTAQGNYNFGIGYYKDEAIIPTQQYNRISLRASLDQGVGKYLRFGISSNSNYNVTEGNNVGLYGALNSSPIANPRNDDGSWKRTIKMPLDEQWVYNKEIVENLSEKWLSRSKAFGSYNTLYGEAKIPGVDGLKYRINLGLNFRMSNGGSYTGEGINSSTANTPSTASISNSLTTNWAVENLLSYDKVFGKHSINLVGMYSAEQTTYNRSYIAARDIPADHFQYFNLGRAEGEITVSPSEQQYQQSGLMSYMGRAMYSYDNKYMLTATVRSDGSSRLAPGHKWHTYPAVSAGWNIKKENFMSDISIIDMLKLRVGYGQTSNQAVDPYQTLGLLNTRPYNYGSNYTTGYYVSQLPNPALGWEYSVTWNFGVDFSLLNGRLSGTFEYYVQNTKDILLSVNLPSTSGVSSYMANIGESQNKGFELSLNGIILDNYNGWTWDAGINLYANRNKLLSLASGQERDESNSWFVGYPIDVLFDYEKVGLWQEGEPYLDIYEPGGNPGMIKVKYTGGFNADGSPVRKIDPDDRQIISLEPNFLGGFNTRVGYKNFDLSIVGAFKNGGLLISTLYGSSGYLNMLTGRRGNVKVDYWTPSNTDAKYPKPGGIQSSDNPKYGSTLANFDATYLKVRTISLGYNISQKHLKNAGIDRFRIYVTVQNPFVLFSPYFNESGMDPETNSYGNENAAVTTSYSRRILTIGTNTPSTRNYLVGLNLTF
jgi:TonB-linked SusC/RagA family outer membrane protein